MKDLSFVELQTHWQKDLFSYGVQNYDNIKSSK
jgi:hypothetical protein